MVVGSLLLPLRQLRARRQFAHSGCYSWGCGGVSWRLVHRFRPTWNGGGGGAAQQLLMLLFLFCYCCCCGEALGCKRSFLFASDVSHLLWSMASLRSPTRRPLGEMAQKQETLFLMEMSGTGDSISRRPLAIKSGGGGGGVFCQRVRV
jgi:hypothetical protein